MKKGFYVCPKMFCTNQKLVKCPLVYQCLLEVRGKSLSLEADEIFGIFTKEK